MWSLPQKSPFFLPHFLHLSSRQIQCLHQFSCPLAKKEAWYVYSFLGEILPSTYSAFIVDIYENNSTGH